ncbi:MAG: type II secretion system F family protein [Dissulfurimicrobium sp.]|uniref:type II secretion system F family protein n=1 Tax=Dissulfurimicrobium sp. TaxID=2022436 RepID=UPI003D0FCE1A
MPIYIWEGISITGEKKRGELEAVDERAVRITLRRQRIKPSKIHTKPKDLFKDINLLKPKIKTKDIVIFTRQLSTMIDAGLPLVQGIDVLAEQQKNKTFKSMLRQIKTDVEGGSTFADALKRHPRHFDNLYTNMVAAGEVGGVLDEVMNRLAVYMEKSQRLKRKVKSALAYPIIVLGISVVVLAIILIFVIPVFEKMFAESGQALPLPTQMVIALSNFVKSYFLVIAAAVAFFVFLFKKFYSTSKGRLLIDKTLLRMPVFGPLIKKVAVAKLTRTLGTLISSGVPIIDALNVAAGTAGNRLIEDAIYNVRMSISEGRTIAQPLQEAGIFPNMVVQMISVGETTGALEQMLGKVADFYDEEVDAAVDALTSMIEPFMIVFLGGTIGSIIIAMYLPIFKMASVVGS